MQTIISLSALNLSQYRQYAKGWKPDTKLLEIFEQQSHKRGKRAYRIYFDYVLERAVKIPDAHVPSKISQYLRENEFELLDYAAGTVKDKHGRVMRLGKVLSKQSDLKKLFDNDGNRRQIVTAAKGQKLVCLSMHPYDVAGMSTDRGWTSCMNLVEGSNKRFVEHDVKANTLIAYMINNDDKNINSPIMRVLLKKFTNGKSSRYVAEVAYPDAKDTLFVRKVQEWVDENINNVFDKSATPTILKRNKDVYDDGVGDFVLAGVNKLIGKSLDAVEKGLDNMLAKLPNPENKYGRDHKQVNEGSAIDLFSKIPEAINYKKISNLVTHAGKFWVDSLENKSNRIKLVRESFMRFKQKPNRKVTNQILGELAKRGDYTTFAAAAQYVSVEKFLETGATDQIIERLMEKPSNAGKIIALANELANFGKNPDVVFWQAIGRVCDPDAREELMDGSESDSLDLYYVPTYIAMEKFNSSYLTLQSLRKVKGEIPEEFYNIWKFLLSAGTKTIVPFKFADYGINNFKERLKMWPEVLDAVKPFKPKLIVHSEESSSKADQWFFFNKEVSKDAVLKAVQEALHLVPMNGKPYTETVPYITCKIVGNNADLHLIDKRGGDQGMLKSLMEEDGIDVNLRIYSDEKTHIPMVRYEGDGEMVERAVQLVAFYLS